MIDFKRTIENETFLRMLKKRLYESIGVNPNTSRFDVSPASISSNAATIELYDIPAIVEEKWIKNQIFSGLFNFYSECKFNVSENDENITLKRNNLNKESMTWEKEEYSVEITLSENSCRISLTDIIEKT